jgi:hypothetical protein
LTVPFENIDAVKYQVGLFILRIFPFKLFRIKKSFLESFPYRQKSYGIYIQAGSGSLLQSPKAEVERLLGLTFLQIPAEDIIPVGIVSKDKV